MNTQSISNSTNGFKDFEFSPEIQTKEKPTMPEHVRVRFCPSPTGIPHVGMVHTALYNWAEARHTGGHMIFRMEDTDSKRDTQESLNMIIEALHWVGIDWDEGLEVGGPHAPYFQSQRTEIYKEVAKRLFEAGYAYESFSNAEEIAARNKAAGRPESFGYDGYDRTMSEEEKEAFRAQGREPAIRLKMPDSDISWNDLIRGWITYKSGAVPDYVIVRPNGDPLYTLTNPVDDALTEANVILRGEDLLPSTPRQIVMYYYLHKLGIAKEMPLFGHLPYIMGEGNKKLSKRNPQSNLFLLRDEGFIPEGLINYLALLGWAYSPTEDIFSMRQLVEKFDVRDVKANPARFDMKKAISVNAEHIRMLDPEEFMRRSIPFLVKSDLVTAESWEELPENEKKALMRIVPLVQPRVRLLSEVPGLMSSLILEDEFLRPDEESMAQIDATAAAPIVGEAIEVLKVIPESEWTAENIHQMLTAKLVEKDRRNPRDAFGPVRVALSGRRVSPPLFESMIIMGKNLVLVRLQNFKDYLQNKR